MDFKHKGITWVGNMYQKFEAVCQEVDHIINQDTVRYVENQVNSTSENVKKFYSDVVQGLLPPTRDPVAPRERVPINACFKSTSHNERKAANSVVNKSSLGHGTTDQIDKRSQVSCKVTFVNQEIARVPSHSLQELNADVPLGKNDDVMLDQGLDEDMKKYAVNELLSEQSDGTLTDKHAFTEPDAGDPLSKSLRNVTSEINHANKRASLVCDDSNLQLEDDVLLGNNNGVLTGKDANKSSEEVTTMEFIIASDPLKPMPNCASCQVKVTNEEAILGLDDSHLPLESSRLSRKNDDDVSGEDSDECSKKVVIMEPDASNRLNNNHPSHVWSETNLISKEATLVCDDSNLLLKSKVLSGKIDDAGKNFDKSPLKLESKLLSGKNDAALTNKYSNGRLKKDTVLELEHYASYPLKNQPGCISSTINYKNEEVSSVSNDSFLKLESEVFCGKNSEALIDKESDASCEEQANSELSTELISHWNEESIKETLFSCYNECEEDIVISTGDPPETSIHDADVEFTHKLRQASSILANNSVNLSPKMETISDYFENGTGYSSNASDVTSSELVSLVLTCGKTVEEMGPFSCLKSLPEDSLSASRSSIKNFSSSTNVHDNPADQCGSVDFETRLSCENKAFQMKLASFRSSSLSMQSVGTHASRANESTFLPKLCTSSHVEFSESTSSGGLSFFTEVGRPYNSSGYIPDGEMETVDLGHEVALKDECDIVDYKALHAVSRRTQKLRSYKKRIQDAFTSKKRLAKEYERLAIWYGDIDLEFSTDSSQQLETKNVSTSYASDSEWEFL